MTPKEFRPSTTKAAAGGRTETIPFERPGFRADIQGLRALAVLLVVAYHAGLPIDGGYVGVDVFFVISGYVIAGVLLRELETTGTIDLVRFMTRRVRRLLPALSALLAVVLLASIVLLSPLGPQQTTANTGYGAALFHANIAIYGETGDYFAPAAELNPLLHTWSLAVEEQFYLVFPLLTLVGWRLVGRASGRRLAGWLGLLAAVSLGLSLASVFDWYPSEVDTPSSFVYYATHYRAWEFLAGAILAVGLPRLTRGRRAAALVGPVGLVAVVASAFVYDHHTFFPGYAALVPVVGTMLLLVADGGPVTSWLSRPTMVRIGDLSYGWYLWHWPAIVFARIWSDHAAFTTAAAVASLLPAVASYRWLETPIRHRTSIPVVRILVVAIAIPYGLTQLVLNGSTYNWWGVDIDAFGESRVSRVHCTDQGLEFDAEHCLWTVEHPVGTLLVIGDSHATSTSGAAIEAGNALGWNVAVWAQSTCPFTAAPTPKIPNCEGFTDYELELALEMADAVLIANRSASYVLPPIGRGSPEEPWFAIHDSDGSLPVDQAEALVHWEQALDARLEVLAANDIPVLYQLTVPEFSTDFGAHVSLLRPGPIDERVSLAELDLRRGPVIEVEQALIDDYPLMLTFDPAATLCDDGGCLPSRDGEYLYMDDHHLNATGAALIAPAMEVRLAELFSLAGIG